MIFKKLYSFYQDNLDFQFNLEVSFENNSKIELALINFMF